MRNLSNSCNKQNPIELCLVEKPVLYCTGVMNILLHSSVKLGDVGEL